MYIVQFIYTYGHPQFRIWKFIFYCVIEALSCQQCNVVRFRVVTPKSHAQIALEEVLILGIHILHQEVDNYVDNGP